MMQYLSQSEATRLGISPARQQSVCAYANPGHVLAPPRQWLEALAQGEFTWNFFRLRYKNLLRRRQKHEPTRFQNLLDISQGEQSLVLTCDCGREHCHAPIAVEFLEALRRAQVTEKMREEKSRVRTVPPMQSVRASRQLMLSALVEHPMRRAAV